MSLTTENTKIFTESTERIHLNEFSGKLIGLAIEVHNALGPGLLESSCKECLYYKIGQ